MAAECFNCEDQIEGKPSATASVTLTKPGTDEVVGQTELCCCDKPACFEALIAETRQAMDAILKGSRN